MHCICLISCYLFFFKFKEEKKESHEYIKTIKDDLPKAYLSCLKAAGYEFDKGNQKALLKVGFILFIIQ